MSGEKELSELLQNINPLLNEGVYVFVSITNLEEYDLYDPVCLIKEKEGYTLIIEENVAKKNQLTYNGTWAWITLQVHSSLEAVGLTATFSKVLAGNGISCNIVPATITTMFLCPIKRLNWRF